MKEYSSSNLRNMAIVGHGKSGKTSLTEALLFHTGYTTRLGKVDDGTSVADFEPEEIKRRLSIGSALVSCEWQDYKMNFLDTPGYPDFIAEVQSGLRAADSVLVVVSAPAGIEVETEKFWQMAETMVLPRAIFLNKMDREHADFTAAVEELRVRFGAGIIPIQVPIGSETSFHGVVDLLTMRTKIVTSAKQVIEGDIPEYLHTQVEEARQKLIEAVAEYNSALLDKYLEGEEISEEEVEAALIEGINAAKLFPVLCGSAAKNIGITNLMNAMIEYMPAPSSQSVIGVDPHSEELIERGPEDAFSAIVFKTTVDPFVGRLSFLRILSGRLKGDMMLLNANKDKMERLSNIFTLRGKKQEPMTLANFGDIAVVAKLQETHTGDTICSKDAPILYEKTQYPQPMLELALKAKNKNDEDKMGMALARTKDEDPTIQVVKNKETKDLLVSGIGELHLDILVEKMKRKYGVEVLLEQPIVPYRETIKTKVKVEGKHKKQSGGHGQYGHVWLDLEPLPMGDGVQFSESIFGGSVPRQYIPAVEKGAYEALALGVLAGYPVVDIKVNLCDGSYHNVDSSEMAFKVATTLAIRKGVMAAQPVLLEPICRVAIQVPDYYMGDVIGSLNAKRARIQGMESIGKGVGKIQAQLPLAELYKYATELRSLSQGRGSYSIEFSHYEEMPERLAETIIAQKSEKTEK